MKKFILALMTVVVAPFANADIKLEENILKNCISDQLQGIMYNCQAREEPISGLIKLNRADLKLHDVISYDYSCQDNFKTDIEVISEDGLTLGKFQYLGGTIENDASGSLTTKDHDPWSTSHAYYGLDCKLTIKSINQDLSSSAISVLHREICTMDVLNNNKAETDLVLQLAQSLSNNVGTLTISQLNAQLNLLPLNLEDIKRETSDENIKASIDSIIGDVGRVGSIKYIMANDESWGAGSGQLKRNMNELYLNMDHVLTEISNRQFNIVKGIYVNDLDTLTNPNLPSASALLSNLNFEYAILNGDETSSFQKPDCFEN